VIAVPASCRYRPDGDHQRKCSLPRSKHRMPEVALAALHPNLTAYRVCASTADGVATCGRAATPESSLSPCLPKECSSARNSGVMSRVRKNRSDARITTFVV
jgi:hypothetical protein